jgi:TonB-dependent receptor
MYRIATVLIFILSFVSLNAQIKGQVTDSSSNERLTGAHITIKELNIKSYVGMNGTFSFKKIASGTYTLICKFPGYSDKILTVSLADTPVFIDIQMNQKTNELKGYKLIISQDKESDRYSRNTERKSDIILNSISASTIELLPDLTIAGVLQRVSGMSLERSSTGDARYAIIRGMDQRYNYTLVNGIKIPSPDNKFRYVPMDMFPSDLLERLDVIKALTPNMEGDAIGGAMNLVMKSASDKLSIKTYLGTGFSNLIAQRGYSNFDPSVVNSKSPADINGSNYVATPYDFTYKNFDYQKRTLPINTLMGFSISNRVLKSKKLGYVFSASLQNLYRASNSIWFLPENQPQPGNVPSFNDIFIREYNTQQTRYGVHNKFDYVFNSRNEISLYNLFMELDEIQYRHTVDTSLSIGRSGTGTGNTYTLFRSRIQKQSIYNSTLQGRHDLSHALELKWSAVYSLAKSSTPDWSEYQTVEVVGYDADGNHTSTAPVLNIPFYRIWTRNSDRDYAAYLNLTYKLNLFRKKIDLSVGSLYRDKFRDNHYNQWNLIPKTSSTGQPVVYDGQLTPDKFQFIGTTAAQGSPINPLTYTATEKIFAYYGQANVELNKKLSVLGGLRVEKTEQGWKTAQDPKISYGAIGKVPYTDFLPSIHFKYSASRRKNYRLSYFKAINRPGFFEYVPYKVNDDNFSLSGNPKLKHSTSDNIDFRFEYFAKGLDQFLCGAFVKKIYNPIETAVEFTGTSSAALKPFNFGTATNFGLEMSFTKYWGSFGLSGNYTYTNSSITTSKLYYNSNFIAEQTTQKRSLQGQSPHIGNLSMLYKNQKLGLDIQLATVYTGKKIVFVSPYKDLDYWQKSTTQIDFSAEKTFKKKYTIYCKINNILNTPVLVQIHQPNVYKTGKFALTEQNRDDRITVQKDYYGQNFTLGIRFKL